VCNRDLPVRQGDSAWRLALPAAFVVDRSGQIVFAFTDVDPARWPDPEEMLASLRALNDASALSNR
jgi:peroxiredoxin